MSISQINLILLSSLYYRKLKQYFPSTDSIRNCLSPTGLESLPLGKAPYWAQGTSYNVTRPLNFSNGPETSHNS